MSWGDVLAAVGGAAQGGDAAMRFQAQQKHQQDLDDLKRMIAQLGDSTKRRGQDLTDEEKKAALEETHTKNAATNQSAIDKLNVAWAGLGQNDTHFYADQARRATDASNTNDLGWSKLDQEGALGYDRNATSAGNARLMAGTSRANALTAADTSRGNNANTVSAARDIAGGREAASNSALRAHAALGVMGLRAKGANSLFGASSNPDDFAAQFDKLYEDPTLTATEAVDDAQTPPEAPAPAGAAAPARPAPVPVAPRGGAAAAPVSPAAAPAPGAAEQQAQTLIQQIRQTEAAGKDATALRQQLKQLRDQVVH